MWDGLGTVKWEAIDGEVRKDELMGIEPNGAMQRERMEIQK